MSFSKSLAFWQRASLCAVVFLAVGVGALISPWTARAADSAASFVETSIEKGNAILVDRLLDANQRQNQFRDFLLSITDTRRVARFTLGSYARGASEPEIASFVTAFTEFFTAIYQHNLGSYGGQTIRVTGSTARSEDDTVVQAEVLEPKGNSPPLKIAFRVRRNDDGRHILTDLQIKGVWLALTQLSDFTSYLKNHGGEIRQLSRELEKRAVQIQRSRSGNEVQ